MTPTRGQKLARAQLDEIAARSDGALEVLAAAERQASGLLEVKVSIATGGYRTPDGLAFRDRERLEMLVGPEFPLQPPTLWFAHSRFAGAPHVQWGRYVCLYQAVDAEWRPADGMFGFVERIDQWLAAAGAGQLDPEDAPLHPPTTYSGADTRIVVRADTPEVGETVWVGRADLVEVGPRRRDLVGWTALGEWDATPLRGTAAIAVLLPSPLPMEFPSGVDDLLRAAEAAGASFGLLCSALRLVALMTPEGVPAHLVLGAPMRRRAAGEPLRQHVTVWEIDPEAVAVLRRYAGGGGDEAESIRQVAEWMVTAKAGWCTVLEDRPEIVNRRDRGAPTAALAGKRVALLGCGALGGAVAEMVVRAGAASLLAVDKGIVRPGLLVRQRYADADIGRSKSVALKKRLDALGLSCAVEASVVDLKRSVLPVVDKFAPDIVIDATASRAVGLRWELDLDERGLNCPLITMTVSAAAEHGSVAVRMSGHRGGPRAVERKAKIAALLRNRDHFLVRAFWPEPGETSLLLPEPGCSEPTFAGSAADMDHHAAGLLNLGLLRAAALADDGASLDLVASAWTRLDDGGERRLGYAIAEWDDMPERRRGYAVFRSPEARRGMEAEVRRIARTRSRHVETGGLVFGEIDDALGRIWVDVVSGPPPDSEMSPERFLCGTAGTVELAARRREASGGSSRFIGIWHTHPVSRGSPSAEDLAAMVQLLHLQPRTPRQVAMLIVGLAATRPDPNMYLFHRDDFRVVAVEDGTELGAGG